MRMTRQIVSGLFLLALFISGGSGIETEGAAHASEGSSERSDRGRQEVVRGILDEFGPGFVQVDGLRSRTAPRVEVKNNRGEVLPEGLKALSQGMMIELVLERQLVVRIQVVSLPR